MTRAHPYSPTGLAAIALARKRVATFPCRPNEKRPLTPRSFYDATTNVELIAERAARWPDANIAIPTGMRSGFVVIDVDRKHGVDGLTTLHAFERELGMLPRTLTASTPNGGLHIFFRAPAQLIRSTVGKLAGQLAPGCDVRGDKAYVLVAPSVVDGRPYAWAERCAPAEMPLEWAAALSRSERLQAPTDLEPRISLVSAPESWCIRALQLEARSLATAPRGTRNDRLWRAASALGGLVHLGAFSADDVRAVLLRACTTWPQRTPSKDQSTIERGLEFGLANPRDSSKRRGHQR